MSMLRLDQVRLRYADAPDDALYDVTLDVDAGRMVSVVGPSGSGKSSLLRVTAGLVDATSGSVWVDERDVTREPTERRDLTVMFQQPHLFEHLDVLGNVAFPGRVAGLSGREADGRARRYLDLVHLGDLARRRVTSISGGQQQRVSLARALAAERRVLLLDEPFSSLDRELREQMHDLLAEVRAALAPTVVFVTHDLDEAALADTTVVLIDGRVHQHAPVAALHTAPATLATARLVGGFSEIRGTMLDGVHRSAWGKAAVASGAPAGDGDALLLVRREDLTLRPVTEQSAPRGSSEEAVLASTGRVTRLRQRAARQVATVEVESGDAVDVELPPGDATRSGDRVHVRVLAVRPAWAVPSG